MEPAPKPPVPSSGGRTAERVVDLRRDLGLVSALVVVVGGTIGSGIFFAPAEVARSLPSGAWAMLVWALGGAVALAGALTYAELGAMLPHAGGPYVYIREAFGRLPAFLVGWMTLTCVATGALAAVSLAFAGYAGRVVDLRPVGGELNLAVATIAFVTLTHAAGLRLGVTIQNGLTFAKIAALAVLMAAALAFHPTSAAAALATAPARLSARGVAGAFVPVLFTIGGWQQVTMVAAEVRDPARVLPRALVLGVGIVIGCYLGVNGAYLRALGHGGLASSDAVAADAALRLLGPAAAGMVSVVVAISILGLAYVVLFAASRVVFAMARDGLFWSVAARVDPSVGSPDAAIILLGAAAVGMLLVAHGHLGALLSGVVFADWIFVGLGAASVFVFRQRRPEAPRPYRVFGYPFVPGCFVAAAILAVASAILAAPRQSLLGAGLLLFGCLIYQTGGLRVARAP